jgi:hypothetical protein
MPPSPFHQHALRRACDERAAYRLMALAGLDQLREAQIRLAQVEAQRDASRAELARYTQKMAR